MEKGHKARCGESMKAFHAFSGCISPPAPPDFTSQKLSPTPSFWAFRRLHYISMFDITGLWLLVNLQSLPLPRVRVGLKL